MKLSIFGLLAILFFCVGCENKLEDVQRVSFNSKTPDESILDFKMVYSDSGFARVELSASLAETFHVPEHITFLKDSLRVNFFSTKGEIISTLTARYGEINYTRDFLTVKDSVRLYNYKKKQTVQTEILYWNQKDSSIYTPSKVIVSSPKGYVTGKGFKTKQDFSRYEIMKPQGNIELDKENEIQ